MIDPEEILRHAATFYQADHLTEAEELCQCVLQNDLRHAGAAYLLGMIYLKLRRTEQALPWLQIAWEVNPSEGEYWLALADTLLLLGQFTEVSTLLDKAKKHGLKSKRLTRLMQLAKRGRNKTPPPPAVIAQTLALFKATQNIELEKCAKHAVEEYPGWALGWTALGAAGTALEKNDAEFAFRRALALAPDDAEVYNNLAVLISRKEQLEEAQSLLQKALQIRPQYAAAHVNMGDLLLIKRQFEDALQSFQRALEIDPMYGEAYNGAGNALRRLGRFHEAEAFFRNALRLNPDLAKRHNALCFILMEQGKLEESIASGWRAVEIAPDYALGWSNLLFAMNYHPDLSAEEIFRAYQNYDEKCCLPLRSDWRPHPNECNPSKRLRVGYVSPDFRSHATKNFLEPLLANHDKSEIEVYAYAELGYEDDMTQRYKGYVDHWVATKGMKDAELAERIRADGVDILVELAGHTAGNRLEVFARKPTPVSLSWMGYGYTTGVSAIDYYLTDAVSAPEGSEHLFAERPWRIGTPAGCYRPPEGVGNAGELPALRRGYVTFGTLTRAVRINYRTIRVWSKILHRLPDAKLVIDSHSFVEREMQAQLAARFAEHGISRERLEIGYHSPPWNVLRDMDIGLDCFPHNSGTTLIESLYMGVPYVTLKGRPSVGRLGAGVLEGLEHPEWIAASEEEYITKAVGLASDLPRLAKIRAGLRGEMERSSLMDEPGFARRIEETYRSMWQIWCAGGA